jgi:hypothetical protein
MLRHALLGLAAVTLLSATLIPDDAFARGGRGGGVRGGAVGVRGGAVGVRGGAVAVRGGAYRTAAVRGGRYGGGYYGARRAVRVGVGAAAVGAAAAGAGYYGGYYGNSCYRDGYGQLICPNQGYGY